jgi:hypothetical protein
MCNSGLYGRRKFVLLRSRLDCDNGRNFYFGIWNFLKKILIRILQQAAMNGKKKSQVAWSKVYWATHALQW